MGKFADELSPKFADIDEPHLWDFVPDTVAWIVQHYIEVMRGSPSGISPKREYMLRFLQRGPLGSEKAGKLTLKKLMDYGRARKANLVESQAPNARGRKELSGATVGSDFTNLSVVLTYAADELAMPLTGILEILKQARRKLKKDKIIAKANIRSRRPTEEEEKLLLSYFAEQNESPQTAIDMVPVVIGAGTLGRRIGELVSIQRKHVDIEKRTYICYQSKQRVWHEFVLYDEALEVVKSRLAAIPDDPEARLWPYNSKSCSQRVIDAKRDLGIKDLRLHDFRRDCFSKLFAKGWTVTMVQHGVSGHLGDAKTLQRVYTMVKPEEILAAAAKLS